MLPLWQLFFLRGWLRAFCEWVVWLQRELTQALWIILSISYSIDLARKCLWRGTSQSAKRKAAHPKPRCLPSDHRILAFARSLGPCRMACHRRSLASKWNYKWHWNRNRLSLSCWSYLQQECCPFWYHDVLCLSNEDSQCLLLIVWKFFCTKVHWFSSLLLQRS